MKFSKIGKHTIRCVISEQEIQDLGYTIEEIMSNGERTQEFMNQIFDMAEQSFETKFELGIKTVCLRILIGCSVMQKTLCHRICLRVSFINTRIAIC